MPHAADEAPIDAGVPRVKAENDGERDVIEHLSAGGRQPYDSAARVKNKGNMPFNQECNFIQMQFFPYLYHWQPHFLCRDKLQVA